MRRDHRPAPIWVGRALAFVGVILVALNLRTAVAALSPIFAQVSGDISLGSIGVGLLGTLPPLCFAAFGMLAPVVQRRVRLESLLVVSLVVMLVGDVLRAASVSYLMLVLSSVLTFAAMGIANVVLPPIVKKYFPDRVGALTSIYATVMALFALLPPLVAVPVADSLGWRVSVGMWAGLCVIAVLPWIALWSRDRRADAEFAMERALHPEQDAAPPAEARRIWFSGLAWAMAVLFGVTAMNVFAVFAWLPEILRDVAGAHPAEAGALLSLYTGMGIPLSLIVPLLAVRLRSIRPLLVIAIGAYVLGYLGLLIAPATATWLWVALAGTGPLLFPLTLVLINLRTRTAQGSVALSGFTQGVGYLIGALGPLLVGILHELTAGWTAPMVFLLVTIGAVVITGAVVARRRMLEDDLHR